MMKRIIPILCIFVLLLTLCSCHRFFIHDGIAVELYIRDPEAKSKNDVYHLQKNHFYKKCISTPLYSSGGIPEYVYEQAKSLLSEEEYFGSLINYYLGENLEGYLYNSEKKGPTLVYLLNGEKKILRPQSLGNLDLCYLNNSFYIIDRQSKKVEVEKIDPLSGKSTFQIYPVNPELELQDVYLNHDESLFLIYCDDASLCFAERVLPDGTCRQTSSTKSKERTFAYAFESADAFCLLETNTKDSAEDLFLRIRHFSPEGRELGQKEIDCKEIITRSDQNLFLNNSVAYHDGILYFTVCDYERVYNYRYDLHTDTLYQDADFKGNICQDYRLIEFKDGKIYTLH